MSGGRNQARSSSSQHPNAPGAPDAQPQGVANRTQPWNQEAEESVVGGILLYPKAFWSATEVLATADDFYHPALKAIYRAMIELDEASKPIDSITVAERMKANDTFGRLRAFGDEAYFAELMSKVVTVENIGYHAKIVRGKATVRRLIEAAQEVAARGYGEYGDPDEFREDAERRIAEAANNVQERTVVHARQVTSGVIASMKALRDRGDGLIGIPTGYYYLDHLISGLEMGVMLVVAARPSMGKSSLVRDMAVGAMLTTGVPVLWFSPEMTRDNVIRNAICARAYVDTRQTQFTAEEWARVEAAAEQINLLPWHIDDSSSPSLIEIRSKARRWRYDQTKGSRLRLCKCGHYAAWHYGAGGACGVTGGCSTECARFEPKDKNLGPAIVVLDYLQRGSIVEKQGQNYAKAVGDYAKGLKSIAKELNICFIAISSLSRAVENRQDKRPVMSDLRESGDIEFEADVILMLYRDEVYNPKTNDAGLAELEAVKQRNGPLRRIHLSFLNQYTRFENLDLNQRTEMEQQPLLDANGTEPARTKRGGGKRGRGGSGNHHAAAGEDTDE